MVDITSIIFCVNIIKLVENKKKKEYKEIYI